MLLIYLLLLLLLRWTVDKALVKEGHQKFIFAFGFLLGDFCLEYFLFLFRDSLFRPFLGILCRDFGRDFIC